MSDDSTQPALFGADGAPAPPPPTPTPAPAPPPTPAPTVDDVAVYHDGTGGAGGSSASRRRADNEVRSGKSLSRRKLALRDLERAGAHGMTSAEFRTRYLHSGMHHGSASGVLSNLHKQGIIARLVEARDGSAIYVLPDHVAGRPTEEHTSNVATRRFVTLCDTLEELLEADQVARALAIIRENRAMFGDVPTEPPDDDPDLVF